MRSNLVLTILIAIALTVSVGCGSSTSVPTGVTSVSVSPLTMQLPAGGTQQFSATVLPSSANQNVTWSISPTTAGSISSAGLYTAPNATNPSSTVTVTATSQAGPTKSGNAQVTLLADSVSVSPTQAWLSPGGTQQFTANVTNSAQAAVTWSASAGTINSSGLFTPPSTVTGAIKVTATLQSDTTQASNASVLLLTSTALTVSPRGPAITVGESQPFTATGTFSDGSTHDWTSQSTWTATPAGVVTMAASTATGASTGVATVKATDTVSSTASGSTAINVTSMVMTNANLSGQYAFSLTHADARGLAFEVGSFSADGNGHITAGHEDANASVGGFPSAGLAITGGSYNVYPDGRGTLNLTNPRYTENYICILSNDGPPSTKGRLILSSSSGVEVGTFKLQTTATLSGNYALLLGGMDGTLCPVSVCGSSTTLQGPEALAGQFAASAGNISGALDVNDDGTINAGHGTASAESFTATYGTTPDSNGRGTLQLPAGSPLSTTALNFAYYVISANEVLLIQTDAQAATLPTIPALAGTAELQTFSPPPSIAGNSYVFLLEHSASDGIFGDAGQWSFPSSGTTLSGEMDVNSVGTTVEYALSNAAAYTVPASNGRSTVSITTTPAGASLDSAVFYLISGAKMYVLETDSKANGGVAEQQTNSSTLLTGTLAFNLGQIAVKGFDSSYSGQIVTSGANPIDLTGIVDSNVAANCPGSSCVVTTASSPLTGSLLPSSVDLSGRGTAMITVPSQSPNTTYGFYLVSPTKMVVFGINSNVPGYQAVDGVIENQ